MDNGRQEEIKGFTGRKSRSIVIVGRQSQRNALNQINQGRAMRNLFLRQRQASVMMVARSERTADHPRSSRARLASATRIGGSPDRRGLWRASILAPVTAQADSITSRTDAPCPLARLTAIVSPPSSRYCKART